MDDTLRTRCIDIAMQPSLNDDIRNRTEDVTSPQWPLLRTTYTSGRSRTGARSETSTEPLEALAFHGGSAPQVRRAAEVRAARARTDR